MGFRRRELNKKLVKGVVEDEDWGRDDPESITRAKGLRVKQKKLSDLDQRMYLLMVLLVATIVGGLAVKAYLDNTTVHRLGS